MNSTGMKRYLPPLLLISIAIFYYCTQSINGAKKTLIAAGPGNLRSNYLNDKYQIQQQQEKTDQETENASNGEPSQPRIALLSSYIASDMWKGDPRKELEPVLDHIINKQCYSHLWNYDYIFNQTQDLTLNYINPDQGDSKPNSATDKSKSSSSSTSADAWWLKFGCWERIVHLEAALPKYDWILYGDIDYIIQDMTRPIESFLKEFDLYGKEDVHVVLPSDRQNDLPDVFSTYALLIRNSPFGFKLLENWKQFALGMCPNGNFISDDHEYNWIHSDQPGLWYALMKTHMDFTPNSVLPPNIIQCDDDTGFLDDPTFGFIDYFVKNGVKAGNYGEMLGDVPDDQKIIFSKTWEDSRSGLGIPNIDPNGQSNGNYIKFAFARHQGNRLNWGDDMKRELALCKSQHACFARLDDNMKVELGCGGESKN